MENVKLPRMVTITEGAHMVGIPVYALRRWVKMGLVPAVTTGNRSLVNLDGLIDFLTCGNGGCDNEDNS